MSKAMCEICGANVAVSLSYFGDRGERVNGEWKLACFCSANTEDYYVMFDDPQSLTVWLEHLRSKRWFVEADWLAAVERANLRPALQIEAEDRKQIEG